MKKIYLLPLFSLMHTAQAQVPNNDFELGFGYGLENVANWGQFFVVSVAIDPGTGETLTDEITWGDSTLGQFCLSVEDAHGGERAMLIRNALNVTQNVVIPGSVRAFDNGLSEFPTGWNDFVLLEEGAQIDQLGFWYKFNRVGNDVAQATLELWDAGGESVGKAVVVLAEAQTAYTYVSAPLIQTSLEAPVIMTIHFSMAAEGATPTFGSLLFVDDVNTNSTLDVGKNELANFTVYPTLATHTLNIVSRSAGNANFKIIDMTGKTVRQEKLELSGSLLQIDVSALAKGIYLLVSESGIDIETTKFIKN